MWTLDETYNIWRITKKSGFLELTFELWKLIKIPVYRLALQNNSKVYRDITAFDINDAKLQANELIYDALRWNR